MKIRHFVLTLVLLLFGSRAASADRLLDRAEVLQIFQKLTSQPRRAWIAAGTIEATHVEYRAPRTRDAIEINNQIAEKIQQYQDNTNKRELTEDLQKMRLDAIPFNVRYKLSNEYTMSSSVTVRLDGDRFYWEINVDSRTDSVKPPADLVGNFMTRHFDLRWNARRIFAWDGEKYTTYSLAGNHAIVDSTGSTPHGVNGPLTAGFIPWGYGSYSYENLAAADSSGFEKYVDGQTQIHLTLSNSDGSEMRLAIDPEKDYAVISCSTTGTRNSSVLKQYWNYQLVSGGWVPTTILIERYDAGANKLLASDFWDFTRISGDAPAPDSFNVQYETDALVEYYSHVTDRPLMYRYSEMVDPDLLLAERLTVAASEGTQAQNCATIAMKYAASELGKDVTDQQLAQLIEEPDNMTSLYAMKEFAQALGLYCRVVKTDIQTLRDLHDCEVILHIPGKNHFVVLDHIDNEHVWCIDLTSNRFYYRTDISFFGMDWTEGTALLISKQFTELQGNFTEIDNGQLDNITGASGYTCTRLLQNYDVIYCSYMGGECGDYLEVYFERWGCEAAESGSCTMLIMRRYQETPCLNDPYNPYRCTITYEWTYYQMRACA
jgi:hypothetical protein